MPNALATVHTLRRASAQITMRQTALLCVKGSLSAHETALAGWWQWWRATPQGRSLACWRSGASTAWQSLMAGEGERDFAALLAPPRSEGAPRWLEFADRPDAASEGSSTELMLYDLPDVMGMQRASMILMRLPDDAAPATFTQLGEASLQRLPIWWGTAGYAFHKVSGRPDIAARQITALAHRYWGVQLLDTTALQWDALHGMPGVNWLSWIGPAFAEQQGSSIKALANAATGYTHQSVFHRLTAHGLSIAAGPQPHKGDMNLAEDLGTLACIADLLTPLIQAELTPSAGPLSRPEVLDAWLHRFTAQRQWLEADTADN